jgi:hypothetical protein
LVKFTDLSNQFLVDCAGEAAASMLKLEQHSTRPLKGDNLPVLTEAPPKIQSGVLVAADAPVVQIKAASNDSSIQASTKKTKKLSSSRIASVEATSDAATAQVVSSAATASDVKLEVAPELHTPSKHAIIPSNNSQLSPTASSSTAKLIDPPTQKSSRLPERALNAVAVEKADNNHSNAAFAPPSARPVSRGHVQVRIDCFVFAGTVNCYWDGLNSHTPM